MAQIGPASSHRESRIKLLAQRFVILALLCFSAGVAAQQQAAPPLQVYGAYSMITNSFNGVPGSQKGLNGMSAGIAGPPWRHLRFKLDFSEYRGTNLGDPQHSLFFMGGAQYDAMFHRERFYAEALLGEGTLNGNWFKADATGYAYGHTGMTASLAEFLGGGIDTPVSRHLAIRIEGGVQHSDFVPIHPAPVYTPYHLAGIPNYFPRFSVGMVWLPRLGSALRPTPARSAKTPVDSEIVFEGMRSFGHLYLLASPGSSYFTLGAIEYDRHSWGRLAGARLDYSADIMPLIILTQPSKTDEWGNPLSLTRVTFPGVGISPIGVRLLWRDGKHIKPYLGSKLGMTGYTQKAFSQFSSHQDFSGQVNIGMQFKLTDRWDFRAGFEYFHQSNGFVVPSDPGLDATTYRGGLSYHLGHARPVHE
jgi:opacity protein-like surface antigen